MKVVSEGCRWIIAFFIVETNDYEELQYRKRNDLFKGKKNISKKRKMNYLVKKEESKSTLNVRAILPNLHYIILIEIIDFLDRF